MLPAPSRATLDPNVWLASVGNVFARFDRQDSGNVSFGVEADGQRYFVKTAGPPEALGLPQSHAERLALLANAEQLALSVAHLALTRFVGSRECGWGRALIYEWADGEHLHAKREERSNPATAWQRFLHLPLSERVDVVRALLDLHVALSAKGWVTGDFYDGCLIYDFARQRIRVFDLDHYRLGAYRNTMGRMFGSTRYMAPEEFEKGRRIDERTTVFALGRALAIFVGERAARIVATACHEEPVYRHSSVAVLAADFTREFGEAEGSSLLDRQRPSQMRQVWMPHGARNTEDEAATGIGSRAKRRPAM